jgi:hypothetical protein
MPQKKGAVGKNTAQEDSPNVAELKSPVNWEKSDGKKILKKELWNVNFAFQSMSIKDIHSSYARFSVYPLKNFSTNFKNLKKKVDGLRVQVDFDEHAVAQHKKSYPRSSHTKQGYPHWNGHPAKEHLEDDVLNRIADTMLPSKLRMTQTSYQEFPQDIFCVRVHAKKWKQREQTFWVAKRNKTAIQCHLKEAAEMRKNREGIQSGSKYIIKLNLSSCYYSKELLIQCNVSVHEFRVPSPVFAAASHLISSKRTKSRSTSTCRASSHCWIHPWQEESCIIRSLLHW